MKRRVRVMVSAAAAVSLLGIGGLIGPLADPAFAAPLVVRDLDHGVTAQQLANQLAGSGVTVSNVSFTGTNNAAGSFSGGTGVIGFESGVILGSGSVQSTDTAKGVEGPNEQEGVTTQNGSAGDTDLTTLSGVTTNDASVLQFDFVPQFSTIQFSYVFSSDEYNEFANTQFNDTFAFFVNGTNCALVPGTTSPVSINTINGGRPFGTNAQHPELYRNNSTSDPGPATLDTEMDGLTTVLPCNALVNAGVSNHMKLAIADGTDSRLDSNVFLRADSLVSGTAITTSLSGGGQSGPQITVPAGTSVIDSSTLSGATATTATGTVTYRVYTDNACNNLLTTAGVKTVTAGTVPNSDPVVMNAPGPYYWRAFYSGDTTHNASSSACGDERVTIAATADFDLTVTATAQPENVAPGGDVVFHIVVHNNGPGAAPAVALANTLPQFTLFESTSASQGGCNTPNANRHVGCLLGSIPANGNVTVDIHVGAPTTIGARLVHTATVVSNPVDTNTEDNTTTAVSTVQPATPDQASGFVPPGGRITTGEVATAADPTVSGLTLPNTGPGANITLIERNGARFCGGQLCKGQATTLKRFAGYNDWDNPPVLRIQYDSSLGIKLRGSKVYMKKNGVVRVLHRCNPETRKSPCILSKRRLTVKDTKDKEAIGDIEVRILVLSMDPRFALR
jgi:uncharacterized repeat protein (TIGR01451 family)